MKNYVFNKKGMIGSYGAYLGFGLVIIGLAEMKGRIGIVRSLMGIVLAGFGLLGICYLLGYGCQQNPVLGKVYLERSKDSPYKSYGLGMMYAEGIGVRENIEKGVEYLKAAAQNAAALFIRDEKSSLPVTR